MQICVDGGRGAAPPGHTLSEDGVAGSSFDRQRRLEEGAGFFHQNRRQGHDQSRDDFESGDGASRRCQRHKR